MGAEIVLHQHDLAGCRKVRVGQSLEYLCIIHSGTAAGDLDVSPSFQWREQHEQIGGAVALILVVVASELSRLGRDRHARFLDELFGCFIQADQGAVRIARPLIDLQHIFHGGYEGGVGLGRNDPLLPEMRLERVFFSVRPIVLSLARATMFSSTTAVSSSVNVQRLRPLGGGEQASAISLASAAPSKMRLRAELGECLWVSAASSPSSTSCRRVRAMVSMLVSSAAAIRLSLHASQAVEASAFSRIRAFSS